LTAVTRRVEVNDAVASALVEDGVVEVDVHGCRRLALVEASQRD
jgi:hypothetical protein